VAGAPQAESLRRDAEDAREPDAIGLVVVEDEHVAGTELLGEHRVRRGLEVVGTIRA
jgi:hypothetical protein